jgi:DNA-directed RNA polymerase specialized sigma subunit
MKGETMTDEAYTARRFFKEMLNLSVKLKINRLDYEDVFNKAQGCGSLNAGFKVQTSPLGDAMQIAVAEMAELDDEYQKMFKDYMQHRQQAKWLIASIPDNRYQSVLRLRYCAEMRLHEVAEEMHYDYDYVKKLHVRALDECGRIMMAS